MLGLQWLRYGVVVCLLCASQSLLAAYPVVGRSTGSLAVQAGANSDWRVVSVGSILPDVAEARTSAPAASNIVADQGFLALAPLSRVKYDLTARRAELVTGKLFCKPHGDQPWTVHSGQTRVVVAMDCEVEVAIGEDSRLTVTVLSGSAKVQRGAMESAEIPVVAKEVLVLSSGDAKGERQPLKTADELAIKTWAKQTPQGEGLGQLVIKDAQGQANTRLNIARYHAEVVLQPPVALVKLDQSFYNPYYRQEEGEFIFNLPPGASVSRFAMFVTQDQLIEGEVIERGQANQIYTRIVSSRRDPAILEQIGDNLFKMRVFPIFPNDVKRILLDFTLPLDGRSGQYQMQLPLMSNLLPIWDFRVFGAIRGPTPLASVQFPTLQGVKFDSRGSNEISFDFVRSNYRPQSDFVVAFQQPSPTSATKFQRLVAEPLKLPEPTTPNSGSGPTFLKADGTISAGWGPWNQQAGTYFQTDLPVPANVSQDGPADVLVLVDTSANATRDRLRPALQTTLATLREQDRFRLMAVDIVARPLNSGWVTPHSPQAAEAYQQFEQQFYLGATDLLATCQAIPAEFADRDPSRRRVVIYIGSGLDSMNWGKRDEFAERCAAEITKAGAVFFAVNSLPAPVPQLRTLPMGMISGQGFFQVGPTTGLGPTETFPNTLQKPTNSSDGRLMLTLLTREAGGRCFDFAGSIAERDRFFEWLLAGVPTPARITQLTVADCENSDVYYPANLLPGEPFRVVGRKLGKVDALNVTWEIKAGKNAPAAANVTLQPDKDDQAHLVGRHWADQRLRHLQRILAAPVLSGGDQAAHHAIVQLSREWSLLTPQTAFLVLETEADYLRWNVPRQARRYYWSNRDLPRVPPLPADWLAKVSPKNSKVALRALVSNPTINLAERLDAARKALDANRYEHAKSLLDELRDYEVATSTDEYQLLVKLTDVLRRQGQAVQRLGIKQSWFDLGQALPSLPVGLDRLLISSSPITSNLLQRHPLADVLLREVTLPTGEMSLIDFGQYLKTTLGINVAFDYRKLEEEQITVNAQLKLPQLKNVTVLSALYHFLGQKECAFIEEPRRLLITTQKEEVEARRRVVFPARDLLVANPKFDFEDLRDPLLDRDEAARQRIESKLKKVVSWRLQDASLLDVVTRFHKEVDENLLIDVPKLHEESNAEDAADISCDYDNVQLGEVLRWILDSKNLTSVVDHEALVITTKTEGLSYRPIRVYPGQGVLYRSARREFPAAPAAPRWFGGFGMGGMGFGGMGGIGGGGMGSIGGGGGLGMAMGGLGGGMAPPALQAGLSDDSEGPTPTAEDAVDETLGLDDFNSAGSGVGTDDGFSDNVYAVMQSIQQQTGGPPDAPWMEADGEGGGISFFHPSLCLVLRQTEQTHAEIAEHLHQQRVLLAKSGANPNMVPLSTRDAASRNELDVYPLMQLIQQITGGPPDAPWMEADGEGGAIQYDRPGMGLAIRQTPAALDEIAGVLVKLRRERYALIHQSRPWEQGIFLDRQPGLFSGPWLMPSSDTPEPVSPVNDTELAALEVRRDLSSGHWKWTDSARAKSADFDLRVSGEGLALDWSGWQIRVQGTQTSVALQELQYAELGNWGQALRDWLDVELVFWPHRSNRELAALFEISTLPLTKEDGPNQKRLRFVPARLGANSIRLEMTFDATSGLPVVWEAYQQNKLVQRYRFTAEQPEGKAQKLTVQQELDRGQLLGRGEWTMGTAKEAANAEANALPPGMVVIDRRPQTRASLNAFETGLQEFRQGRFPKAAQIFKDVLDRYPDHPLVLFLMVWCLDREETDADVEQLRTAYAKVTQAAPSELVRLLVRQGSKRLSDQEVYDYLQARPQDKRDIDYELTLARFAFQQSQPKQANKHARAAWDRNPGPQSQALEAAQLVIESSLRTNDVKSALAFYDEVAKPPLGWRRDYARAPFLFQLLGTFEYFNRVAEAQHCYRELLDREDPTLTVEMRRSLLKRYADNLMGSLRWKHLLTAIDLLPQNSPDAVSELEAVIVEVRQTRDPANFAELAMLAQHPHYRQRLQAEQADWTTDLEAAREIYWKLHQAGYQFEGKPERASERLIEAKHPDEAVAVMESSMRRGMKLTKNNQLTLAKAYQLSNRPLDAKRVLSDNPLQ